MCGSRVVDRSVCVTRVVDRGVCVTRVVDRGVCGSCVAGGTMLAVGIEVSAGDIADINQIEAGVHIGRHFVLQKIDDDFSCRCGFDIPRANGGGRIDNHHRQALLTESEGGLFRQDFAALVVANGVLGG